MNVRPGNLEIAVTLVWISIGSYFGLESQSLVMGVIAGVFFLLGFWGMLILLVSATNVALLPSYSRAPFSACVAAPLSTGLTLLILKGWPRPSKVGK